MTKERAVTQASAYRERGIRSAALSGLAGRGLSMALSMISLPLSLTILDRERYGLWLTVGSLLSWLAVADLGLGNSLITPLAAAVARGDTQSQRQSVSTTFFSLVSISAVLALVFFAAYPFLPWRGLLNASAGVPDSEIALLVVFASASFFVSFPLGIGERILGALQLAYVSNAIAMGGNVVGVIALALAVWLKGGLLGLLLATGGVTILVKLTTWLYLWAFGSTYMPRVREYSWPNATKATREGITFLLLQLMGVAIWQTDNIVVAQLFGSSEVTDYAVTFRLGLLAAGLAGIVTAPLWPAYADALARDDVAWVQQAFRTVLLRAALYGAACAVGIALLGVPFIRLWTHDRVNPDFSLVCSVALYVPIQVFCQVAATALNAMSRTRLQLLYATAAAVLNLVLSIALGKAIGPAGVCLATSLAAAVPAVAATLEVKAELKRLAASGST